MDENTSFTGPEQHTVNTLVHSLVCLTQHQTQLAQRHTEMHVGKNHAKSLKQELRKGLLGSNTLKAENSELKLELLRWRKKVSIYRLKLASTDEDARLHLENAHVVHLQLQSVLETNLNLDAHVAALAKKLGHAEAVSSMHSDTSCRLQADLTNASTALQATRQHAAELEQQLGVLKAQHDSLQQQLEGAHAAAQAAGKRGQELQATLTAAQTELTQVQARNARLEQDLAASQSACAAALERENESEGRARVAIEAKAIAERAIKEWQRMAEERRLVMQEHEQQLLKLSQERMRLDTDRASATEAHLQAQLSMLQKTLESETSKRQDAELQMQQLVLRSQAAADSLHSRIRNMELQLATKEGRIKELEDLMLKQRAALPSAPHRQVDDGLGGIAHLVQSLLPRTADMSREGQGMGEDQKGAKSNSKPAPRDVQANAPDLSGESGQDEHGAASTALAIASRTQAHRAQQQQQQRKQQASKQEQPKQAAKGGAESKGRAGGAPRTAAEAAAGNEEAVTCKPKRGVAAAVAAAPAAKRARKSKHPGQGAVDADEEEEESSQGGEPVRWVGRRGQWASRHRSSTAQARRVMDGNGGSEAGEDTEPSSFSSSDADADYEPGIDKSKRRSGGPAKVDAAPPNKQPAKAGSKKETEGEVGVGKQVQEGQGVKVRGKAGASQHSLETKNAVHEFDVGLTTNVKGGMHMGARKEHEVRRVEGLRRRCRRGNSDEKEQEEQGTGGGSDVRMDGAGATGQDAGDDSRELEEEGGDGEHSEEEEKERDAVAPSLPPTQPVSLAHSPPGAHISSHTQHPQASAPAAPAGASRAATAAAPDAAKMAATAAQAPPASKKGAAGASAPQKTSAPAGPQATQPWVGAVGNAGVVNGGVTGVIGTGSHQQQHHQLNQYQGPRDQHQQNEQQGQGGQHPQIQLPQYQPRVTQNPLAALNHRVTEAAALRRPYVALSAKEALKLTSLRNEKQGVPGGSKRKQDGSEQALMVGDAAPHSMLMNTLMPPKVRRPGE